MPKSLKIFLLSTFVLASPAGFGDDIRSTKHNLTGHGDGSSAQEVCVFCHTPSLSDAESPENGGLAKASASVEPPVWHPSLQTPEGGYEFGIYDDIGRGVGAGSQSMACLSCHDFTQAWGSSAHDHPIGVPYRGAMTFPGQKSGGETLGDVAVRRAARFLQEPDDFRPARLATINNREVWWVPTSDSGIARTRQDIPLYVRDRADQRNNSIPYLECSSCHDPHSSNKLFLRVSNQQSRLCMSCHER